MIEIVAFDFDRQLLIYRDGQVIERAAYHYDNFKEAYSYEPILPVVRTLAPEAPIYHLPHDVFMRACDARPTRWNYAFVLELARAQGQVGTA